MAADRIREAVGWWGPVFCSGWGQWEAPQQCTFFSQRQIAEAVSSHRSRLTSVGLPVAFARVAIADDAGNLLPVGNEGEVVVAGDHLMVGYLDKPKETADIRFHEWQRTGDIGRIDKDGFVYLTDRKRDIIISGGSNIFPREIEEVLYAHPAILEAVVIGIPDIVWGEIVHGVAVLRKGKHAEPAALLAWSRERLQSYKRQIGRASCRERVCRYV